MNLLPVTSLRIAGLYQPPSDAGIRAPLLEGHADGDAESPAPGSRGQGSGDILDSLSSGRGPQLWAPLEYDAMPRWRWVDWCRYLFYRSATGVCALVSMQYMIACTLRFKV